MSMKDIDRIYNGLKSSAKKRGIPFELSKADLYDIDIPITCPMLGIQMMYEQHLREGSQVVDGSPSYDRIDNSKGYCIDNLMIISYRANKLKGDATIEEIALMISYYSELLGNIP